MIASLYEKFKNWAKDGSVYIIADTHFEDSDCPVMDPNWISPQKHVDNIKKYCHKNDTIIHLGDVGNPEWMNQIKSRKILIMGNHDESIEALRPYFDEIYQGPLFIAPKILLSHEPIPGLSWCVNVHGHDHNQENKGDESHINLAANVVGFRVFKLGKEIKSGMISDVCGIHRKTIGTATKRKEQRSK